MTEVEDAIAVAAKALDNSARGHKRAQDIHRQHVNDCRTALSRLREFAAVNGMELIIKGVGGKNIHGHHRERRKTSP